jgi:hypothetical protein
MKHNIVIFILSLISLDNFSQKSIQTTKQNNPLVHKTCEYQKKWKYFKLNDTLITKLIDHIPAPAICGDTPSASLSIVITAYGDTIRILDLCNQSEKYKLGQIIKVAPVETPKDSFQITLPFTMQENAISKENEPSTFDLLVLKTTWGKLLDN